MALAWRDWALPLKNIFLPIHCKQCDRRLLTEDNGFFCPTCWEASPRIERPFCTVCGKPHRGAIGFGTQSNFPCAECRGLGPRQRVIRSTFGAAYYDAAVSEAIKLFKFHDRRKLVEPLAELMHDFAGREMTDCAYDWIAPVPLYWVRERERGFNQSRLLAQAIAPDFPGAALGDILVRVRPTKVQSRIKDEAERKANVRDAFAHVETFDVSGKCVLLIDDVVTTGGTVGECAKVLRKAGAAHVDVFAAALSVPHLEKHYLTSAKGQSDA